MTKNAVLAIRIESVKPYTKNTLRAFVDFELVDLGLLIRGSTLHEKGEDRWLSLPSREHEKNGERTWTPVVEYSDKQARYRLQDSVLAAYEKYVANHPSEGG